MKEKLHDHILSELRANEKTNTTFVITALAVNILTLSINAAVSSGGDILNTLVMALLIILSIAFSSITVIALSKGRDIRSELIQGLTELYKDEGVDKYYKNSLIRDYELRYKLLSLVIILIGIVSVIIPLLIVRMG